MLAPGELDATWRREAGRCLATLIRVLRDVDLAEEALADAIVVAAERWLVDGVPPNPGGWLTVTARRRALDRLRREATRGDRHRVAHDLATSDPADPDQALPDDPLRLMFLCCHPALGPDAQVALCLRLLGGLQTPEIARAYLVPEATIAQRLVRAKKKIRDNRIPYRIPEAADLPERLRSVLSAIYLVFNEGYLATSGPEVTRVDLSTEAIRLGRLLVQTLPDEPEAQGLLALMLLTEARRPARSTPDGDLVLLPDQDRSRWDRDAIAVGHALVRGCLRQNRPGPYQLQAAIAAIHADAPTFADTDWAQIVASYDHLLAVQPTPVVAMNRAIAVAELRGPAEGLAALDQNPLPSSHLWHAARAELLTRLARPAEARAALDRALDLAAHPSERRLLTRRRDLLG